MSTLVTNTITGLSTAANITIGSTPVVSASANSLTIRGEGSAQTSVQQGLAKGWINLNAGTTINDSFNIAALIDNGTGDYTFNYANDFNNAHYSLTCLGQRPSATAILDYIDSGMGTGGSQVRSLTTSSGAEDVADLSGTAHGDLA